MQTLQFSNRYLSLGADFYQQCNPTPVSAPSLIKFNQELANDLGLSLQHEDSQSLANLFSGNVVDESSQPLAMAYAGHQFGHFNPHLGDGRAIYLGELKHIDGSVKDIQLKGSGRTPYSRNGDGRSALGPVLREYLLSESMYQLGIPTTRALAAVSTGEQVFREGMKPSAIMTRVASSFIRVGSFQFFAMQNNPASIKALADYVIKRNYSELKEVDNPYLALLEAVVLRQATLIAKWTQFGFIHGVMNTDNMSVAGETIDYGPCAFMDHFAHNQVYSSIDHQGRYAYNQQPNIGIWNLSRFAETLLPLIADDTDEAVQMAQTILEKYVSHYAEEWLNGFRKKCGLTVIDNEKINDDKVLLESLLNIMHENQADFSLTFYYLSRLNQEVDEQDEKLNALFTQNEEIESWLQQWRRRIALEKTSDDERQTNMQTINPVYIPRNHQVEKVIRAAEDKNDFEPFHKLYEILQKPYEYQLGEDEYMQPPKPKEIVYQTFCGT